MSDRWSITFSEPLPAPVHTYMVSEFYIPQARLMYYHNPYYRYLQPSRSDREYYIAMAIARDQGYPEELAGFVARGIFMVFYKDGTFVNQDVARRVTAWHNHPKIADTLGFWGRNMGRISEADLQYLQQKGHHTIMARPNMEQFGALQRMRLAQFIQSQEPPSQGANNGIAGLRFDETRINEVSGAQRNDTRAPDTFLRDLNQELARIFTNHGRVFSEELLAFVRRGEQEFVASQMREVARL